MVWVQTKNRLKAEGIIVNRRNTHRWIMIPMRNRAMLGSEETLQSKVITLFKKIFYWSIVDVYIYTESFPSGSDGKESACNAGDSVSIPGSRGFSGEGNGNPLQYSCLENSMDRGAWQPIVHGITESHITKRLSLSFFMLFSILVYHRILNRIPHVIK